MKKKIGQIRQLLDEIESHSKDDAGREFSQAYDGLELPGIVSSIVKYLHPLLTPYEIAVYWHLFQDSVVETGEQYVRTSIRGMSSIAKSASGQSDELSYGVIKRSISALIEKKVLSAVGETNNEGTIYKVSIPEEIPDCQELMKQKFVAEKNDIDVRKELDYYNIPENRLKIYERDGFMCHYCNRQLTRFSATLDHIQPVSKSGDNSFDNLVTCCLLCNSRRGNKPVMDFVVEKNS